MGTKGKSNRYLGAHNPSTITGVGQDAFGTWWPAKETVSQAGKGKVMSKLLRRFTKGDIWPNPMKDCARMEAKCFHSPKSFGGG